MERALVLNASHEPLGTVSPRRAAVLVLEDKAVALEAGSTVLHSPSTTLRCPSVIRLRSFVHVPYRRLVAAPTLSGLVARDGRICAYCTTRRAATIDHVVPRSKGGPTTWENTVAACGVCNARKADRTPHEAGMRLAVTPHVPRSRVWLHVATNWSPTWEPYLASQGYGPVPEVSRVRAMS